MKKIIVILQLLILSSTVLHAGIKTLHKSFPKKHNFYMYLDFKKIMKLYEMANITNADISRIIEEEMKGVLNSSQIYSLKSQTLAQYRMMLHYLKTLDDLMIIVSINVPSDLKMMNKQRDWEKKNVFVFGVLRQKNTNGPLLNQARLMIQQDKRHARPLGKGMLYQKKFFYGYLQKRSIYVGTMSTFKIVQAIANGRNPASKRLNNDITVGNSTFMLSYKSTPAMRKMYREIMMKNKKRMSFFSMLMMKQVQNNPNIHFPPDFDFVKFIRALADINTAVARTTINTSQRKNTGTVLIQGSDMSLGRYILAFQKYNAKRMKHVTMKNSIGPSADGYLLDVKTTERLNAARIAEYRKQFLGIIRKMVQDRKKRLLRTKRPRRNR